MVGREIKSFYVDVRHGPKTPGFFKVRNARSSRYPGEVRFVRRRHAARFSAFAGLVGAGRSEIAKAIVGLDTRRRCGSDPRRRNGFPSIRSRDAIDHGIYLVPEDRRGEGLVTGMTVRENITLPSLKQYSRLRSDPAASRERQVARRTDRIAEDQNARRARRWC